MLNDSLRLPPTEGFHCGERIEKIADDDDDDDDFPSSSSAIVFFCNVPPSPLASPTSDGEDADGSTAPYGGSSGSGCSNVSRVLRFRCREPSCGALEGDEPAATWGDAEEEEEHHRTSDPHFFDGGYTMAGATGFKVWTGTRLLIETLAWPTLNRRVPPDAAAAGGRLADVQRRLANGAAVVELGAGVGVVGTYLACVGANVLLTDLPTLVDHAVAPNVRRNGNPPAGGRAVADTAGRPPWFRPGTGVPIGRGWAAWTPLDWTVPIDRQLSPGEASSIDFIVASDVVFLVSMLDPLLDTVAALFDAASSSTRDAPSFILSFQRRDAKDGEESSSFTTVTRILKAVGDRGWTAECLSWRTVAVKKETGDGATVDDLSEVYVYEIRIKRGRRPRWH